MSNIKSHKVPKLRFPGFSGDWEEKKLGELASKVGSGSTPRGGSKVYKKTGVPFVRSQNVTGGKLDMSDVVFIDETTHESMKNSAIQPNDVLLNITGASLGRTCVVPNNFKEGNLSQHVCIIRLNGTNPYLVHTVLSKPKSLQELLKTQTGGGKEGLNFQAVRAFKLVLPGKNEQQKIAGFLGTVDERVSALQRKVELMKKYKKGIMQKIFSQEVRFPGFSEPWQLKKLDEVFDQTKGSGLSKEEILPAGKNKCVLYGELYTTYPEIIAHIISRTDSTKGVKSKTGDLLVPCSTTTTGIDLANVTEIREGNVFLGGDITILRFKNKGNSTFYAYYLTHYMKKQIASYAQGSTIVHLYFNHFKNMTIDVPPFEEQQKIADFLTSIDNKIDLTERKLEQAKQFKKALLQQMFV